MLTSKIDSFNDPQWELTNLSQLKKGAYKSHFFVDLKLKRMIT